jgi:hypothetical protein
MLTIFRRHFAQCKFKSKGRKHPHCNCPLAVEGNLRGESIRRSLDIRNWEAAHKLVRDLEFKRRGRCGLEAAKGGVEGFDRSK